MRRTCWRARAASVTGGWRPSGGSTISVTCQGWAVSDATESEVFEHTLVFDA